MHKSLVILLMLFSVSAPLFAGTTPPAEVVKAFQLKFPDATHVRWEKENATEYEANFTWNGADASANFKADGTWLETETGMTYNALPEAVRKAFEKEHAVHAGKVSKIEKPGNA